MSALRRANLHFQITPVNYLKFKSAIRVVSIFCLLWNNQAGAQATHSKYGQSSLVNSFYSQNHLETFWQKKTTPFSEFRECFLHALDSCANDGLDKNKYNYFEIKDAIESKDSIETRRQDELFTDALIRFTKDLYAGSDISKYISNDEVSAKYIKDENNYLLEQVLKVNTVKDLNAIIVEMEPKQHAYAILKKENKKQLAGNNKMRIAQLKASLNLYRWMHHFRFNRAIIINIPAAELGYYEKDQQELQMKVVVGKPTTRSPRFATWCNEVILYPYWNVPPSIATKELLPMIKKSPARLKSMNLEVIGRNGDVVDALSIDWSKMNRNNFPYRFRQCTGCDNSLGVIKFNLTDPFNVYLHDTNYKLAFLSASRFLSHGCIRVEKPIELGNHIMDNQLDSSFLKACYKQQKPIVLSVPNRVPVFVVYMVADVKNDSVIFHKDTYHLF